MSFVQQGAGGSASPEGEAEPYGFVASSQLRAPFQETVHIRQRRGPGHLGTSEDTRDRKHLE